MIVDKEEARKLARKEAEHDEATRYSLISISTHLVSVEDEEMPANKKRRDKENVLRKKNDGKKKPKVEAKKEKSKDEAEVKDVVEREI
jgi:hypothetical protein